MTSLHAAELARDKVVELLRDRGNLAAVGIVRVGTDYGLRVRTRADDDDIPSEMDGVVISSRRSGPPTAH